MTLPPPVIQLLPAMSDPVIDTEKEWVLENLFRESYPNLTAEENRNTPHARWVHELWSHWAKEVLEDPNWDPLAEMRRGAPMARHVVATVIKEMRGW